MRKKENEDFKQFVNTYLDNEPTDKELLELVNVKRQETDKKANIPYLSLLKLLIVYGNENNKAIYQAYYRRIDVMKDNLDRLSKLKNDMKRRYCKTKVRPTLIQDCLDRHGSSHKRINKLGIYKKIKRLIKIENTDDKPLVDKTKKVKLLNKDQQREKKEINITLAHIQSNSIKSRYEEILKAIFDSIKGFKEITEERFMVVTIDKETGKEIRTPKLDKNGESLIKVKIKTLPPNLAGIPLYEKVLRSIGKYGNKVTVKTEDQLETEFNQMIERGEEDRRTYQTEAE